MIIKWETAQEVLKTIQCIIVSTVSTVSLLNITCWFVFSTDRLSVSNDLKFDAVR